MEWEEKIAPGCRKRKELREEEAKRKRQRTEESRAATPVVIQDAAMGNNSPAGAALQPPRSAGVSAMRAGSFVSPIMIGEDDDEVQFVCTRRASSTPTHTSRPAAAVTQNTAAPGSAHVAYQRAQRMVQMNAHKQKPPMPPPLAMAPQYGDH